MCSTIQGCSFKEEFYSRKYGMYRKLSPKQMSSQRKCETHIKSTVKHKQNLAGSIVNISKS